MLGQSQAVFEWTVSWLLSPMIILLLMSSYHRGKGTLSKFGHRIVVLLKPSLWMQMYFQSLLSLPKSNVLCLQEQLNDFYDKNLIVNCDLDIKYVHRSFMFWVWSCKNDCDITVTVFLLLSGTSCRSCFATSINRHGLYFSCCWWQANVSSIFLFIIIFIT